MLTNVLFKEKLSVGNNRHLHMMNSKKKTARMMRTMVVKRRWKN